jgi:hypothetical protein
MGDDYAVMLAAEDVALWLENEGHAKHAAHVRALLETTFHQHWLKQKRRAVAAETALATAAAEAASLRAEVEELKGSVVVPLEPTDGMQQDGLAALEAAIRIHGKPSLPGFAAAHVYRAMVAARPSTTRGEQADA